MLITGATGLIGREIVMQCHERGFHVNYLTTRKTAITKKENYQGFYWNPSERKIDSSCFDGVSVIINLAGSAVSKRWTKSYKKEILDSRVESLKLLENAIGNLAEHNIKQLITASAIGIYPDSLEGYYEADAEVPDNDSFLGEVVTKWEAAAENFKNQGILVSKIRIGLVLSSHGGAFPQIVKPIKYGLGAGFGSGDQWQSWIHVEDLAAIFLFVLSHGKEGVFNGVAPNPVTNSKLTKEIASVLKRPVFLPNIPKSFMTIILGEMSQLLFESQRVSSKKLENSGFHFAYPNIKSALQQLLTKENNLHEKLVS